MTKLLHVVEIDSKYDRAIFIGNHPAGDTYFALAIRRLRDIGGHYWCFYLGISDSEWSILTARNVDDYSFLSVPNDAIMVPQLLAERFILNPPKYFVGVDMPFGAIGDNNTDIITGLQLFVDSVYSTLKEESHAGQQAARLVSV